METSFRAQGGAIIKLPKNELKDSIKAQLIIGDKVFEISAKIESCKDSVRSVTKNIDTKALDWIELKSSDVDTATDSYKSVFIEKKTFEIAIRKESSLGNRYVEFSSLILNHTALLQAIIDHRLSPEQLKLIEELLQKNEHITQKMVPGEKKSFSNKNLFPLLITVKKNAMCVDIKVIKSDLTLNNKLQFRNVEAIRSSFEKIIHGERSEITLTDEKFQNIGLYFKEKKVDVIALGNEIGRGASKTVRQATSLLSGKMYAYLQVREDRKDSDPTRDLLHEIELSAKLKGNSRHIVLSKKITTPDGKLAAISELCHHSLDSEMEAFYIENNAEECDEYSVTPEKMIQIQDWCKETALGLQELHNAGFCHLDIKPDNIYLQIAEDNPDLLRAKVGDLGFASRIGDKQLRGTLDTMSPEMLSQIHTGNPVAVTPAMDVWSLGALCFLLRTGLDITSEEALASARDLGDMTIFKTDQEARKKDLLKPSELFDRAILRMLEIDPTKRPTIDECISLLKR